MQFSFPFSLAFALVREARGRGAGRGVGGWRWVNVAFALAFLVVCSGVVSNARAFGGGGAVPVAVSPAQVSAMDKAAMTTALEVFARHAVPLSIPSPNDFGDVFFSYQSHGLRLRRLEERAGWVSQRGMLAVGEELSGFEGGSRYGVAYGIDTLDAVDFGYGRSPFSRARFRVGVIGEGYEGVAEFEDFTD